MRPDVDAVVVGSGPNGLFAAVALAEAGWRVLVLEASNTPGGGLSTEEVTVPGFRHDICSTAHPMAMASPAFRAVDLARDGLAFAHAPAPLGHPLTSHESAVLQRDVAATAATLGRDGPRWSRVMGALAGHADRMLAGVLDPTHLPPHEPLWTLAFGATGVWPASWVDRVALRDPSARALLAGAAGHSMLDLSSVLTTGVGALLLALGHAQGWPFAVGGSQSIADALVARITALGGEVRCGHRVRSMADVPACRAVLFDVTPRQVLAIIGDRLSGRYRRRLERWRYGAGSFKVDWALDGPVPWADPALGEAGIVHIGGPSEAVMAAERTVARGGIPERPFVLFAQATVADPSRAPAGKHTGWGYCHVPHGSNVDMTTVIEAQVELFAPGFRERIIARHSMALQPWRRTTPTRSAVTSAAGPRTGANSRRGPSCRPRRGPPRTHGSSYARPRPCPAVASTGCAAGTRPAPCCTDWGDVRHCVSHGDPSSALRQSAGQRKPGARSGKQARRAAKQLLPCS